MDWLSKKLYIATENSIVASSFDGQKYYTIVNDTEEIKDIVVSPSEGLLFWIQSSPEVKIERSYMDGYNRTTLIQHLMLWPTGLAVDHTANRLYWVDYKAMTIETVNFQGKDRQIIKKMFEGIKKILYSLLSLVCVYLDCYFFVFSGQAI